MLVLDLGGIINMDMWAAISDTADPTSLSLTAWQSNSLLVEEVSWYCSELK